MKKKPQNLRLTDLDRKILSHIQRYGLTTAEVLKRVFFQAKSVAALKSNLHRLRGQPADRPFVRSAALGNKQVYYYLTAYAAKHLGSSTDAAGPFGPQARFHRLAVLLFIHAHTDCKRTLFRPHEFSEVFPLQGHRLNRNDFYIEEAQDKSKLGSLIVDHGAHPRRIVAKTLQRLGRFCRKHWFDQFIKDRAFAMTVLTYSEGKKAMILPLLRQGVRLCLARKNANGLDQSIQSVDFHVEVVDGLQDFLPGA